MIESGTRFRLNVDAVGAKVIDGEAIIVNVVNGRYHSMDGSGAVVWQLMDAGGSIEEIVDALSQGYDVDPERARSDVEQLARELVDQDLMILNTDGDSPRTALGVDSDGKLPYEAPELVTYTDIEELLALDPPMPLMGRDAWKVDDPVPE
jgi:hypothetical protein